MSGGWVYILGNRTLYVWVTGDISRRRWEHRTEATGGFTTRYALKRLVHTEHHEDIRTAVQREKTIEALAARLENPLDFLDQPGLDRSPRADCMRRFPFVMPGLGPGIHVLPATLKTWMAGTSPAMTHEGDMAPAG